MNRSPAVLWIGVVLLLLLPTAAGRLLLDLAGGVLLALLALPFIPVSYTHLRAHET